MPAFDYKGAKADGVSDADIAAYIDAQRAKGVDLYISRSDYTSPAAGPRFTAASAEGTVVPQFDTPQSRASYNETMGALPMAGGMIGGALGGPPGAAAGAFLGELGRQGMIGEPLNAGTALRQGVVQGGLEGAGRIIGYGVGQAAAPLMKMALAKGTPAAVRDLALSASPGELSRAADVHDALAATQSAFGMPQADLTQELADNLRAAADASTAASSKWVKMGPWAKRLTASELAGGIGGAVARGNLGASLHAIPYTAAAMAANAAATSPALRYYLARGLASPGLQGLASQSPRAAAALWSMLSSAPADVTSR